MTAFLKFLAHLNPAQLHAFIAYLEALARHAGHVGHPISCGPHNIGTPGYTGPCA